MTDLSTQWNELERLCRFAAVSFSITFRESTGDYDYEVSSPSKSEEFGGWTGSPQEALGYMVDWVIHLAADGKDER